MPHIISGSSKIQKQVCGCGFSVDHHRSLKMGWLPAFYRESLAGYWAGMKLGAERLAAQLTAAAEAHKEVDLWELLGRMTMEVTANTAFGYARHWPRLLVQALVHVELLSSHWVSVADTCCNGYDHGPAPLVVAVVLGRGGGGGGVAVVGVGGVIGADVGLLAFCSQRPLRCSSLAIHSLTIHCYSCQCRLLSLLAN